MMPAELHPITVNGPWHRIGIDLIGPLPITAAGNVYIVTCSDYFTKWPEACAVPDKSAISVADFLFKLITIHGSPAIVQSDQGREFINEVNARLFQLTGVEHRISAPYHPQTNGLDERFNQTLVNALTKMTGEKQNEWDRYIDAVLFAYRTSLQSSSKFTPFELMLKRKPRLPIEVTSLTANDDDSEVTENGIDEYMSSMMEWTQKIHEKAEGNISEAQKKQKKYFDAKHRKPNFKIGDIVWSFNSRKSTHKGGKLDYNWNGPYEIVEQTTKGTYRLKNMHGNILKQSVSSIRLKVHIGDNDAAGCDKAGDSDKAGDGNRVGDGDEAGDDDRVGDGDADKAGDIGPKEDTMKMKIDKTVSRKRDLENKTSSLQAKRTRSLVFSRRMRNVLKSGEWLDDDHMFLAQQLLQIQFPNIGGLQSTLLSQCNGFAHVNRTQMSIQIHHVSGNHWVTTVTSSHDQPGEYEKVSLYDSKYSGELCSTLTHQMAQIYRLLVDEDDDELCIHVPNVQQQQGSRDCGLFAIAFALHSALGQDIPELEFNQSEMRKHLINCFSKKLLTPFPTSDISTARQNFFPGRSIDLYCDCRMPESFGDMVECEKCESWYHQQCVDYSPKKSNWICRSCLSNSIN